MRNLSGCLRAAVVGAALVLASSEAGAQEAFLIADVARGPASSFPFQFTPLGPVLFFAAGDDMGDVELWRSDGTAAGTVRVKDVNPTDSSFPDSLVPLGGMLFFTAADGVHGQELWKSDGTADGTVLVKDIRPGTESASLFGLAVVGSLVVFRADDGTSGRELWRSDGSDAGTVLIKDINPAGSSGLGFDDDQVVTNGTLFFFADDGVNGSELWKSDGTGPGTVLVRNIRPGPFDSEPFFGTSFGVLNDTVFFFADDGTNGEELWKSNGTALGTMLVKDIRTGSGDSQVFPPAAFATVGGALFFPADDAAARDELWKTDGTGPGTVLVKDIAPGTAQASPRALTPIGGTLFFAATDASGGRELWRSDGTPGGTVMVKDIFPGIGGSSPSSLTALDGTLFFTAADGTAGRELWRSDGTEAGTVLAADILPGAGGSDPQSLLAVNGVLVFTADDGVVGEEPWVLTACGDGVVGAGESCDDGNRVDDCCSAACMPAPAGQACEDGDACTAGQTCDGAGACGGGAPLVCDDGAACTVDTCVPASGCQATAVGFATLAAAFAPGLGGGACAGMTVPESLTRLFERSAARAAGAEGAAAAPQRRILRRVAKRLGQAERRAGKVRKLDPACRAALAARFAETRTQVTCLVGGT